ncbi:MAG: Diphthine synthase [Methanonatronarchaeales archaeon]|nr:Diphthine synthase [Methanonatronarchaeales archaeon]
MLVFVGLGLHDARDVSLRGLREVEAADRVFAELYTSAPFVSGEELRETLGRDVRVLTREQVEEERVPLEAAEDRRVVFLVGGEPMTATTHVELMVEAERRGIPTRIVHSSSIVTAAPSLLGLMGYKFGRDTTLPFPYRGKLARSPLDVVEENLERGLHTLVLLDIKREEDRYLTAGRAVELMLEADGPVQPDTLVAAVARAGSDDPRAAAGYASEMVGRDLGPPLHCLVVPGDLHFKEAEALVEVAGAPDEVVEE